MDDCGGDLSRPPHSCREAGNWIRPKLSLPAPSRNWVRAPSLLPSLGQILVPSPHQSQIGLLPFADRRLAGNFGFCQKREGSIINAGRNTFTSSLLFHKKRLSSRFTWYVYVFKGLLGNLNWAIGWGQQVTSYIFTDHQLGDSSLLQNKM